MKEICKKKNSLFTFDAQFGRHEIARNVAALLGDEVHHVEPVALGIVGDLHAVALLERDVLAVARLVVVHGDDDAPLDGVHRPHGRSADHLMVDVRLDLRFGNVLVGHPPYDN